MSRTVLTTLVVLLAILVLAFCAGAVGFVEIPFWLVFGWIAYLSRIVPAVTVSWPGLGMGIVALVGYVGRPALCCATGDRSLSPEAGKVPVAHRLDRGDHWYCCADVRCRDRHRRCHSSGWMADVER